MTRFSNISRLVIICGFLCTVSCKSTRQDNDIPASCEGVICTKQFAAVTVQILDVAGAPALLDSTLTLNSNGVGVTKGSGNADGFYTIIDDNYHKALEMRTEEVRFTGYEGGKQVIEERFTVSADCCHVSKVSGPAVLTIK